MKRFYWLLALPYVVKVSYSIPKNIPTYSVELMPRYEFGCGQDKDFCEDLAAALNEAHERNNPKGHGVWEKYPKKEDLYWKDSKKADDEIDAEDYGGYHPPQPWIHSKKAEWEFAPSTDYPKGLRPYDKKTFDQEACGQDDCGADPK